MMLSKKYTIIALTFMAFTSYQAEAGSWVSLELSARGGCKEVNAASVDLDGKYLRYNMSGNGPVPIYLGRTISDVSDEDITEAFTYYKKCFLARDSFSPDVPLDDPRRAIEAVRDRKFVEQLLAGPERNVRQAAARARAQIGQDREQLVAQKEAQKQRAIAEELARETERNRVTQEAEDQQRQRSENEARRRQQSERYAREAKEQAQRDRDTAEELDRQAEAEEKLLGETKHAADEARKTRLAAEQRLTQIRKAREEAETELLQNKSRSSLPTNPVQAENLPIQRNSNLNKSTSFAIDKFDRAFDRLASARSINAKALKKSCSVNKKAVCMYVIDDKVGINAFADKEGDAATGVLVNNGVRTDDELLLALKVYDIVVELMAPSISARERQSIVEDLVRSSATTNEATIHADGVKFHLQKIPSLGAIMFSADAIKN